MNHSFKQIIKEAVAEKLNENILSSSQVKKIEQYFDVVSNAKDKAEIKVDFGPTDVADIITLKTKNNKIQASSGAVGTETFKNADEFIKNLMYGIDY